MNSAVNFIIESGVSLALLSLIYVLFLRKETFFRINRLFLLGSVLFSVILPVIKLRIFAPQSVILSEITVTPYRNLLESITVYSHGLSGTVEQAVLSANLLIYFYIAGVAFFFGRFLFRILQLLLIIRRNGVQSANGFKLVILEKETSPYSFLNYVFVSQSLMQSRGYDKMIEHEVEHVKQGHSLDVIILELLTVFQWFNPFMWMLNRAIRETHEFLADQAVLSKGVSRGEYKLLLLNQFVGGQLVIANNFNYSLIKNRIKMMSKIKSSKIAITKIAFGLLVATALIVAFACEQKESVISKKNQIDRVVKVTLSGELLKFDGDSADIEKLISIISKNGNSVSYKDSSGQKVLMKIQTPTPQMKIEGEEVFYIVEEMPEYPGGEMALRQYMATAVKYPDDAVKKGIQGKVYVTFVVSKDGTVADAKIARGVDPSLDTEALRVVNNLPKWKPGKQKGQAVNVSYTVPINFKLQ
jgi:TonB family protein